MPLTLPAISRRRFIASSLAAGVALALPRRSWGLANEPDPNRFALLSDTHVDADPKKINRNTNMYDNLQRVCEELTKLETRPAAVLINGDLAHNTGEAGDYATLLKLLDPVRERGMPIHLGMGNHDHRERFWQAIAWNEGRIKDVQDRQLTVLETPRANWFILDSLDKTNVTPGTLGESQLKWLALTLDARPQKPAIVMVHHDPVLVDRPRPSGLLDTAALLELFKTRKQVQALIFGHTHNWSIAEKDGIRLINLPPTAYPFNDRQPSGWVDCVVGEKGMMIQLHALNDKHADHMKKIELPWRS